MRRKTHEQFLREMEINHPTLSVLGKYKNGRTRIRVKCNVCGNEFNPVPGSLYMKVGCPYCAGVAKKTTEQFKSEMLKVNEDITVLGEYANSKSPIKVLCNKCNYVWEPSPNSLLCGKGCPKCSGTARKTHEQFLSEMAEKHPDIKVLSKYINNRQPIECLCLNCGDRFSSNAHKMLCGGNGCPNCTTSRGENRIKNWLKKKEIKYYQQHTFNDCKDAHVLPFDFYLPNHNTIIEYDGIQHFESKEFFGGVESFQKLKKHDGIKNSYCDANKIRLIRIPYTEYENIENILENELVS